MVTIKKEKRLFLTRPKKMKTTKHSTTVIYLPVSLWKIRGDKRAAGITWFKIGNWYCQTVPLSRRVHWGCPSYSGCPSPCLHNSSFILCLKSQGEPINTTNKLGFQPHHWGALHTSEGGTEGWGDMNEARAHEQIWNSLQRMEICTEHREIRKRPDTGMQRFHVSPPVTGKAPSDRSDMISRSCLKFWTRLLLIALKFLHGFYNRAAVQQRQNFIFRVGKPSVFLQRKNLNNWTWSVWILENVASLNPEALSCAQKETEERGWCSVPRWKLKHPACLPPSQAMAQLSLLLVVVHTAGVTSSGHLLYGRDRHWLPNGFGICTANSWI